MTTKERICRALMGQMPDRIPFAVYTSILSSEEDINHLVSLGTGLMKISYAYSTHYPNIEITEKEETLDGIPTRKIGYRTPIGEIWQRTRLEPGYGSTWLAEHFIKDVKDYAVLEFILRDMEYSSDYDACKKDEESVGDSGTIIAWVERVPIQRLWIQYTGIERLSIDLHDNPLVVEGVLEAMMDKSRELWGIVAESPARFVWCPDNITGVILGPPLFDKYCIPYYREVADVMHKRDKRVMCHMDGMMGRLVDSVGKTDLDIIEAFTPPPDGDLALAEARKSWQGKVVSINFPSSVHLATPDVIRDTTLQLLREAAPGKGFVVSVTEDIPKSVGTQSLSVIADTIGEYGDCPISV